MNLIKLFQEKENNNKKYFLTLVDKYKEKSILDLDFNIFSCRQILEEIILECKSNKLSNKINNDFLKQKIDYIIRVNYLVTEKQKKDLNYIKEKIFEKNDNLVYMLSIEAKNEFCTKEYFDKLVNELNNFLADDSCDNSKHIKTLVDFIYVDLIDKGYSMKEISDNINNLFSHAEYDKSYKYKIPRTAFPINYIKGRTDPYELTTYINQLSFNDRINYIKNFYITKKNIYYLIIPISGITLTSNHVKCNEDISLYNPKYIDPFNLKNEKLNHRKDEFSIIDYTKCSNACIKVSANDSRLAFKIGIKKINNYINILKLLSPDNNLSVMENCKILLNDKKQFFSFSATAFNNELTKREFERNIRPLNEEDIFDDKYVLEVTKHIKNLINVDNNKNNNTQIVLLNSIKKYSEGLENTNEQEAVLKFWSSIESLFDNNFKINNTDGKFETIREVISSYMTFSSRYLPLHRLYNELAIATNFNFGNPEHRSTYSLFKIPVKLLKKINLYEKTNKSFSLLPLVKYNKDIQKYLDDYYYLQKVIDVDKYFNDINYSSKKIKENKNNYETNILIIYRLRNQIIHNALSNEITTNFYYPVLKRMANFFLNEVLNEYINDKSLTINEIILKIYSKSILFIKNTESCSLLSLLF